MTREYQCYALWFALMVLYSTVAVSVPLTRRYEENENQSALKSAAIHGIRTRKLTGTLNPPLQGDTLLLWLLPFALMAISLGVVITYLRRRPEIAEE